MNRVITKEEVMSLILEHAGEIADILLDHLQEESDTSYTCNDDPVKMLSADQRKKLIHKKAFRRAFEAGHLRFVNGKIIDDFESSSMLAYLLGKLFCDDRSVKERNGTMWVGGQHKFPEKMLKELFGKKNLRELRNKNIRNKTIIKGYKMIDNLFVA